MNLKDMLARAAAIEAEVRANGWTEDLRGESDTLVANIAQARADEARLAEIRSQAPAAAEVRTVTPAVVVEERAEAPKGIDTRANLTSWVERDNRGAVEVRAVSRTTADNAVRPAYEGIQRADEAPLDLLAVLPSRPMTAPTHEWTEQVLTANAVAAKAEGEAYSEQDFEFVAHSEAPSKFPVFTTVTEEALRDVNEMEGIITGTLDYLVRNKINTDVLTGSGVAPNVNGIMNRALGTYVAPAGEHRVRSLLEAQGAALVKEFAATHAFVSVDDWVDLSWSLMNDFKNAASPVDGLGYKVAGLTIIPIRGLTSGTALVLPVNPAVIEFRPRTTMAISKSDSHGTNFTEGLVTIKAVQEAGLAVYRPASIVKVTFAPVA